MINRKLDPVNRIATLEPRKTCRFLACHSLYSVSKFYLFCYHRAFYPYFCIITIQYSISFHQGFCIPIARCCGLLEGLYSVISQSQFHPLCVALRLTFASDVQFRITVANRFPASFRNNHPLSTWQFHNGRHTDSYAFITLSAPYLGLINPDFVQP